MAASSPPSSFDGDSEHKTERRQSAFGTFVVESLDGVFLTEEEKRLNKVQETLAKFDDGDGTIDADEMERALQAMGFESLRGAFETMYGVGRDDVFPVRDRIRMWETTKQMMKGTFQSLLQNRQYEACEVLKARMDSFDEDLEAMHQEDQMRHRRFEERQFQKAAKIVRTKAARSFEKSCSTVREYAERKVVERAEVQGRGLEELDIRVAKFPSPSRLSSKQMLEFKSQELNLAKRGKFDDAAVMRRAVNQLEGPERGRFDHEFKDRIGKIKENLLATHSRETEQLRQQLVNKELSNGRHYERDVRSRDQRTLSFLRRDMSHSHHRAQMQSPPPTPVGNDDTSAKDFPAAREAAAELQVDGQLERRIQLFA